MPYGVALRDYQKIAWNNFFKVGKKHHLLIWHRRAGKSKFAVNVIASSSQIRVGAYYYLFPKLTQARRVIWEGRGEDGFRFIDHFPPEIIKKINNTEMKIEFNNGSIFRLVGTDNLNYDSLMGGNPLGILYDEFAMQNPVARDFLIPIIAENNGWEMIISTPRGTNHMYDLYEHVKEKEEWNVDIQTIDDTYRDNGLPVVSHETIEDLKASGWSEDKVNQEFYCSFTASVRGAYFADQLRKAEISKRIIEFGIDTTLPVNTYWDLGHHDATSIWFVQNENGNFKLINYYENNNQPLSHFVTYLHEFRAAHGIVYDMHFGPHDVTNKHGATGKSYKDVGRELGILFERVPRVANKDIAIEDARAIFNRCTFHKTNCKHGITCLREYHKAYDEKNRVFGKPIHNWSSHGADAFMTLAQASAIVSNRNSQFNIEPNLVMDDFFN